MRVNARSARVQLIVIAAASAAFVAGLTQIMLGGMPGRLLGPDLVETLTPCAPMTADARAQHEDRRDGILPNLYSSYVAARKVELIDNTGLVLTAIRHLRTPGVTDAAFQQSVESLINDLNFGKEDGYFFLYDIPSLTPIAHPRLPGLVGKSLADNAIIQKLVRCASDGGGFQLYPWNRPSTGRDERKLGYVVPIQFEGWNPVWMLGTGLYVEDVENAREQMHVGIAHAFLSLRLFAFGVVFVVVLAVLVAHARRRQVDHEKTLRERILAAQEELRKALADELHDGSLQVLLGLKLMLENSYRLLTAAANTQPAPLHIGPRVQALEDLRHGLDRLHEVTIDIDRITKRLMPIKLIDLGLLDAIESDVREFSSATGIATTLQTSGNCDALPDRVQLAIYRVTQEAQRNVYKHAQATRVEISLVRSANDLTLTVTDDGRGFDPELARQGAGLGLRSMQSRVQSVAGALEVSSLPGRTRVSVRLPVEPMAVRRWLWRARMAASRINRLQRDDGTISNYGSDGR